MMKAKCDLRRGFTLIELLVVIAIISILATILIPSLKQAQDLARSTTCMSNMRGIGVSCQMFASDNDGELPSQLAITPWYPQLVRAYSSGTWVNLGNLHRLEYVESQGLFFCPAMTYEAWMYDSSLNPWGGMNIRGGYYYHLREGWGNVNSDWGFKTTRIEDMGNKVFLVDNVYYDIIYPHTALKRIHALHGDMHVSVVEDSGRILPWNAGPDSELSSFQDGWHGSGAVDLFFRNVD